MLVNGLYLAVSTFTAKKRKEKVKNATVKCLNANHFTTYSIKKVTENIFLNEKRVYNKKSTIK